MEFELHRTLRELEHYKNKYNIDHIVRKFGIYILKTPRSKDESQSLAKIQKNLRSVYSIHIFYCEQKQTNTLSYSFEKKRYSEYTSLKTPGHQLKASLWHILLTKKVVQPPHIEQC